MQQEEVEKVTQIQATVTSKRWGPYILPWWVLVAVWFGSCGIMITWWSGKDTRKLSFEDLVYNVNTEVNPEAVITELQARVLEAIRAIRRRQEGADRAAKIANSALDRFHKETEK